MPQVKFSNYKLIFIFVAVAVFVCGMMVSARMRPAGGTVRVIEVSGECTAMAAKDRTSITIRIENLAATPLASSNAAREKLDKVVAVVRNINDDTMEMQTQRFDSYEKTEWSHSKNKSITLGFETSISLEVTTENQDTIEAIIQNLPDDKGIQPGNLRTFSSTATRRAAIESCLAEAVVNAREKAAVIAAADNMRVGRLISVGDSRSTGSPALPRMKSFAFAESMDLAGAGNAIFTKDSEISVSVSAIFEMRP